MLRQCVECCPDDLWLAGEHPRNFWRIAYHAAFYTHFYMGQNLDVFEPWSKHRDSCTNLWADEGEVIEVLEPYTKSEVLEYIDLVDSKVDSIIDGLDLDAGETGFWWYDKSKKMNKLDHEIMTIRHVQGHMGQLSEILMAHGIDVDWVAIR